MVRVSGRTAMIPTPTQYDSLERAVARGQRIAAYRRGTEYVIVPLALTGRAGRELIEARNPATGDHMTLFIDELESFEIVE